MQKITPFMWFDDQAEEAVNFYLCIFKHSKITSVNRYGEAGPGRKGTVMSIAFQLEGQDFVALNGGPLFPFTQAISFVVNCETQAEVDDYWEKLSVGGRQLQCAWLNEKYGVPWQIVPTQLVTLLTDPDPVKSTRAMQAMLTMTKIDIAALQSAYDG